MGLNSASFLENLISYLNDLASKLGGEIDPEMYSTYLPTQYPPT